MRPHCRETVGGDLCLARPLREQVLVGVMDVLGHGEFANCCARKLLAVLQNADTDLLQTFSGLEAVAARTRGCVLLLALLGADSIEFILVGNIRGWLMGQDRREVLFGQPSIVGARKIKPLVRKVGVSGYSLFIACTDGIRRSFAPSPRSLCWHEDVGRLAQRIGEEFALAEDDACVLVARRNGLT